MKQLNYVGLPAPKEVIGKNLMGTLGKAEAEEMFGELLKFSFEQNRWVAPTVKEFGKVLDEKLEAVQKNSEARQRNFEKRKAYEKRRKWRWALRLVGKKVVKPQYEEVKNISSIMEINPNAPVIGMQFMMNNGFVEVIDDESDKKTSYFALTPKAINTLK